MSVLSTLMAVIKFAPIQWDLFSVIVTEDTLLMWMKDLALVGFQHNKFVTLYSKPMNYRYQ